MSAAVMVMAVLVAGSGCKKECPAPPACPTCPDPTPAIDAATEPPPYDGYSFKLVEKDGKVGFVATSSKGRVVVIPLDPRTRMFADGKEGTTGELLSFSPSTGGCPCRLPQCWPYCRVADPVLTLDKLKFWGSPDVPEWPAYTLPEDGAGGGTAPAPAPAPAPGTEPAPAPAK